MKLEKRSSFGWPATTANRAPCDQGLVVHYDGSNQGLARKSHSACRSYWKGTRSFHMGPQRGWRDIGYSFGVCPHGYVLEGRGWQREQAAQPGGNTTWTSVTFMSGDAEEPTGEQVEAFRQLRAWLRGKGLGAAVRGHRDFISTSCPGSILYGMVQSGALVRGAIEEDDVSAEDVWNYGIDTGDGKAKWRASTVLGHLEKSQDRIEAKVDAGNAKIDAQGAAIAELSKTVAQLAADRGQAVDADALVQRIEQAIERVTVRLDVQPDVQDAS